jgi:hypothetical protein
LLFDTFLMSDLEARQKEARLYISAIGDILCKHIDGLQVYRPYCTNQANAASMLEDLKASDSRTRDILNTTKVADLDLEHYLLLPMQRLTRYPLLLSQILKHTDPASEECRRIKHCVAVAESVLTATNEAIREEEDLIKLWVPFQSFA